ncbi:MAG: hypothetical protein ACOX2L_03195 [Anaerolineae bacterium]|jgi:hypothetical protein|nr:hypothetical protein [Chloroflexota bacterium]
MQEQIRQLALADPQQRLAALKSVVCTSLPSLQSAATAPLRINLHAHTIYSYNGYGYSPAQLAWLARSSDWYALATVDFDVLDGVDETLAACEMCGLRGAAGLETRVSVPDRADTVFNSPGEPGVMYLVGMGFVRGVPQPKASAVMQQLASSAQARNREMISRLNAYLAPVTVDYERDVRPLTPSGNATERHLLLAYDAAARRLYPLRSDLLAYWSARLGLPLDEVARIIGDEPFPHDAVRARLMKQGGPGYMAPDPTTFPAIDTVIEAIAACGALPCYPFVDGTSAGEADMPALLEDLVARGIRAMVVIPDRNWNVADTARSQELVAKLAAALQAAAGLGLPVFIGTEMNKPGQLLVDDLSVAALAPHAEQFRQGADMLWGHTALARAADLGYQSEWAQENWPSLAARARFYTELGAVLAPSRRQIAAIATLMRHNDPATCLRALGSATA